MPFIVATYVYASSQGQRTHFARTNYQIQKPLVNYKFLEFMIDECTELKNVSLILRAYL